MQSIIPNSDAYNWVIDPACQCVLQIGADIQRHTLIRHAIGALPFHEKLLERLFEEEKDKGKNTDELIKLIIPLRDGRSQQAAALMEDDFDPINRQMLISLWGAVEVAIEDTVLLILTKEVEPLELVRTLGLKKLPENLGQPLSETQAAFTFGKLEWWFREEGKKKKSSVAENYCDLLSFFGISLNLQPQMFEELSEISALRHCLLHRNGLADEAFLLATPSLSLQLGDRIKISSERYLEHFHSVATFATALLEAVLRSRYVRYKDQNFDGA